MMRVEYITHSGSDDLVVDAARASFAKLAKNYTPEQNEKLIKYLATHNHWTPFAHPQITLFYTVPLFVARQEFKHVIGFVRNEQSRRYVDDTPAFYTPDTWRSRPDKNIKQGSGNVHPDNRMFTGIYGEFIKEAQATYENMIACGIAPEQARMVLPQSMLTSYYVTGSLAAFARAYKLRSDSHAQVEIQTLAQQWDEIIRPLYPVSWAALTD